MQPRRVLLPASSIRKSAFSNQQVLIAQAFELWLNAGCESYSRFNARLKLPRSFMILSCSSMIA